MGIFDKFSIPGNLEKKKTFALKQPNSSPIMGQASTFKTLATFDLKVDAPKFVGDVPNATISYYEDLK